MWHNKLFQYPKYSFFVKVVSTMVLHSLEQPYKNCTGLAVEKIFNFAIELLLPEIGV